MEKAQLDILTIKFKNSLKSEEIGWFRGAILAETLGKSDLFHNHTEDSFHYRYPLIQYKKIAQSAGILLVGEGIKSLADLSTGFGKVIRIGERHVAWEVDFMRNKQVTVQTGNRLFTYHIANWLPLNQANYMQYAKLNHINHKIEMLEKILQGHILAFSTGIGLTLKERVMTQVVEIENDKIIHYKGQKMQAFDLFFKTNLFLPNYIGLGKGVSIGMGTIKENRNL